MSTDQPSSTARTRTTSLQRPESAKLKLSDLPGTNGAGSATPVVRAEDDPNAHSRQVTTAPGPHTHGALNVHPAGAHAFTVGVSDDRGVRRTMEDAHAFAADFAGVRGQGYFAIFDGHAGKHAAEWCGAHFHEHLLENLRHARGATPIPDVLNATFHAADAALSRLAAAGATHSGCTAVAAFLRLEDEAGGPAVPPGADGAITAPPAGARVRRVLYTADVGDARAVLCRAGRAVRLTYDHKGSDRQEAKRITDAGGFVMNNRVNGVLAVTRSLGDTSMKEFVVGAPYTTETELGTSDEFLIIACDGLWDVIDDQAAVDLVRALGTRDAQAASARLLEHALANFSTDNVTVLVVRLDTGAAPAAGG